MTVNLLRSAALSCLLMAAPALAQTTTTPPAPPADPAPPPADDAPWSLGGIDFSGYVDAYANVNFNNPNVTSTAASFGVISSTRVPPRILQIAARIHF